MADATKLLPCPLCNSPAIDHEWYVSCSGQGDDICILQQDYQDETNVYVSKERWNARALDEQQALPEVHKDFTPEERKAFAEAEQQAADTISAEDVEAVIKAATEPTEPNPKMLEAHLASRKLFAPSEQQSPEWGVSFASHPLIKEVERLKNQVAQLQVRLLEAQTRAEQQAVPVRLEPGAIVQAPNLGVHVQRPIFDKRLHALADDIQMVGFADNPNDVVELAKGYLALEALLEARAQQAWLLINEAPTDGTQFLATGDAEYEGIHITKYSKWFGVDGKCRPLSDWVCAFDGYTRFRPTHWRPLPPPPSEPQGGGQ